MTELSFAKSFLATLDQRPLKLPPDYVFDPRTFAMRLPFTLPPLPHPPHPRMPKKIKPTRIPGSSKSITLHLRSVRNPVLQFTLDNVPLETVTIQELKEAVQEKVRTTNADKQTVKVPLDKIKILWNRKPVQKKTVAEILGNEPVAHAGGKPEFGVMILGGASVVDVPLEGEDEILRDAERALDESEPRSTQENCDMLLQTASFWNDLQDFLELRTKNESEATRLKELFKRAWSSVHERE